MILYEIKIENLLRSIDEIELSVRTANRLKKSGINLIGQLVQMTETDLLAKRFSKKSIFELKEQLLLMGLTFGMKLDEKEETGDQKEQFEELSAIALINGKLKLIYLSKDKKKQIYFDELYMHGGLHITSSESTALKAAVEELEELINDPNTKENELQDFFERNPEFILNDSYKEAHPKIVLDNKKDEKLIPDFILEPYDQGSICDILDIKLASCKIWIMKKNRTRFSQDVLEACAQLREYSRYFDEEDNRNRVLEKYGLSSYKPKLIVIIGRRGQISPIIRRHIESGIQDITVSTYDDVLSRMRHKIKK